MGKNREVAGQGGGISSRRQFRVGREWILMVAMGSSILALSPLPFPFILDLCQKIIWGRSEETHGKTEADSEVKEQIFFTFWTSLFYNCLPPQDTMCTIGPATSVLGEFSGLGPQLDLQPKPIQCSIINEAAMQSGDKGRSST